MYQDTITAIATPMGESALGIVRLSGPEALPIAHRVFSRPLRNRRLVLGHLLDPRSGEVVDETMAAYLAAPHTYTREDMVEFSCHGGALPLQRVLEVLLAQGARLASPGEFTLRAFLNGRIDLAQAESVLDIIQAKTQAGLRIALQGLEGRLSKQVRALRSALLEPLAYLTALVDFPEDEIEHQDVSASLEAALQQLQDLTSNAHRGMAYRHGVRTAIVGRPNAGKSSLLNRLLGHNRAIVASAPGTTRDTLEELANIRGIPFCLIDTAGITATTDPLEQLGVERSHQALASADLVLLVVDSSQPLDRRDYAIATPLGGRQVLVVANKRDLPSALRGDELAPARLDEYRSRETMTAQPLNEVAEKQQAAGWPWVRTSALTEEGLEELEETMADLVLGGQVAANEALLVSNPRHKTALDQAAQHTSAALDSFRSGMQPDFVTIDLTAAVNALGQITGETVEEDLLNIIFSRFCIGK